MVGARAREIFEREAQDRKRTNGGDKKSGKAKSEVATLPPPISEGTARDKAGEVVGVSGRTLEKATKVLKQAVPEIIKAVDAGRNALPS